MDHARYIEKHQVRVLNEQFPPKLQTIIKKNKTFTTNSSKHPISIQKTPFIPQTRSKTIWKQ